MPRTYDDLPPEYRKFCTTERQKQIFDLVLELGTSRAAAKKLNRDSSGVARVIRLIKKRAEDAARNGHAPGHWDDGVAPGYHMDKVTIQRGPDGVERVWERQSPASKDISKVIDDILARMLDEIPASEPKAYSAEAEDLLYVIPIGDAHFGSYAWKGDTGDAYDLKIASQRHRDGIDALLSSAPQCKRVVVLNLGDFFDSNCSKNRTPRSGNVMDPSGSYNEILAEAAFTTVYMIDRALERGETVEYVGLEGNHDPEASAALCAFVFAWYRNEPRVVCQMRPHVFWYLRYGKVLLGAHHGHGAKPEKLPGIMAADRRDDWAKADFCYWLIGHFHHKNKIVSEETGATVEGFNTLVSNNLHHHMGGYRSALSITGIVYSPKFGEFGRDVRNVQAISALAA